MVGVVQRFHAIGHVIGNLTNVGGLDPERDGAGTALRRGPVIGVLVTLRLGLLVDLILIDVLITLSLGLLIDLILIDVFVTLGLGPFLVVPALGTLILVVLVLGDLVLVVVGLLVVIGLVMDDIREAVAERVREPVEVGSIADRIAELADTALDGPPHNPGQLLVADAGSGSQRRSRRDGTHRMVLA